MKNLALRCASILPVVLAFAAPAQAASGPAYMKADRSGVEKGFEALMAPDLKNRSKVANVIAGNIFSAQLTANRKKFIDITLKNIPAKDCPRNPPFTLIAIAPLFANDKDGTGWEERFEIACKPAVIRNVLFTVTRKAGVQMAESVPGESLAPVKVRNEFLPKLLATASSDDCKDVRAVDARVTQKPEKAMGPWTETWTLEACGKPREIGVSLTPGESFTWTFTVQ